MKKLFIPVLVCLFSFGSINANNVESLKIEKEVVERVTYDISSFCKLIQKGNFEAVKSLIESGEDVNKKSKGLTPLMFAARHNKAKIAKLLIKHGAKLKARSDKGRMTALDMAKRFKAKETMNVIKSAIKS